MTTPSVPMPAVRSIVGAPLVPTMMRLAVPGVLGALVQSAILFLEARALGVVGTTALAAAATVFPLLMLANMMSTGAIGGAVSGAVARAMGAGDIARAERVLVAACVIALVGGSAMGAVYRAAGPAFYAWVGASDATLAAAVAYADTLFLWLPVLWAFNLLGAVLRGTGDMLRPALCTAGIALSYEAIAWFAIGGEPDVATSMRDAAWTLLAAYGVGLLLIIVCVLRPAQPVRLRPRARFDAAVLRTVLGPGLLASTQSALTVAYAMFATALFARHGPDWLAGYGLAVRLELLLVPVIFGIGGTLIAIVGAYVGAGQRDQAIRIAWRGTFVNVAVVAAIGALVAVMPGLWCDNLSSTQQVAAHCATTLRALGPFYGFFALGLGLYFASQALAGLVYPVAGAALRLVIVGIGAFLLDPAGAPGEVLALVASAMVVYGLFVAAALRFRAWRSGRTA